MDDDIDDEDYLEEEEDLSFNPDSKYTGMQLQEFADAILKEDSNRELCRICKEKDIHLPYGEETGQIESVPQYDENEKPILDEEGNQLYVDYPELKCKEGHRWFKGEGARRDIKGPNPILFESHLYTRRRREIYAEAGTVDPAFNMDRFGRPAVLLYNRTVPGGRRVNTPSQRKTSGASFYR